MAAPWSHTLDRFWLISRSLRIVNSVQNQSKVFSRSWSSANVWKDLNTVETVAALDRGRNLKLSSGKYARFADGSATAQIGDTVVLVTAVSKSQSASNSFVPLTVDYRQKSAAAGRIPTNFLRRESGPSEHEILTGRLIDRSIRNMFPDNFSWQTQIVCNLLAVDGINNPDIVAINAASAALAVSDIPWLGPVGAVRVGLIENEVVINPTRREMSSSILNLVITGTLQNSIVMMEAAASNVFIQDFQKALKKGLKETQIVIRQILELQKLAGKPKRQFAIDYVRDEAATEFVKSNVEQSLKDILSNFDHDKVSRDVAIKGLRNELFEKFGENKGLADVTSSDIMNEFDVLFKGTLRNQILCDEIRCDGRKLNDIRDINCEVDLFKPLHGSALFQRGQTQCLCTVTLDSLDSAFRTDPVSVLTGGVKEKNFMLHYEFPQYAVNEIGGGRSSNRREIGHGALAEKALRPVLPEDYPFTVRLTSEVLESNGSSSMATVCGGSLALMDAGVPLTDPVAGVAVGLVMNEDGSKYKLLTDILGIEDYLGDMDFKMAGTKKGITALQCDTKVKSIPSKIMMEAIQRAFDAKSKIINIMNECLHVPRSTKKDNAPVTENITIPLHKRSKFMGYGGYNIKKLASETGVNVTSVDETTFSLFAPNTTAMDEAKEWIENIMEEERAPELQFGAIYKAKIVELLDTGVLVTLYPTMAPTLVPNSQLDNRKVSHPRALDMKLNDEISVKYFGHDPVSGRMRLSRKVLQMPAVSALPKSYFESTQPEVPINSTEPINEDVKGSDSN